MSNLSILSYLCAPLARTAQRWLARLGLLALLLAIGACAYGPPGPDIDALMKTPTPPRRTPTPPAVTPARGPAFVGDVTWANQANGFLVSFYLYNGRKADTALPGWAHLQISKKRDADGCVRHPPDSRGGEPIPGSVDPTECLLLDVTQRVERADYVFEYKQYLDMGLKQWRAGWHYWYTFPLLSFDAALQDVGMGTVWVMLWFENEDGEVYGGWREMAKHEEGSLSPPLVPLPY
jgi:hypothetical protein